MSNMFNQGVTIKPILIGFAILVILILASSYARGKLMEDDLKSYVRQNIPEHITGEERNSAAARLATEYVAQPLQASITFISLAFCLLLAGYVTGKQSSSHLNAIIVALIGALFVGGFSLSWTLLLAIIAGVVGSTAGSMLAITKKNKAREA